MSTLAQGPDGDLLLTRGGLSVVQDVDLAAAQLLTDRFKFWLGEWFLDPAEGVPYLSVVFVKNPNVDLIRSLFRKIILGVEPIKSVEELLVDYSAAARSLTYTFRAKTASGATITGGSGAPFEVSP